ncbi:MAG: hypothetical protein KJ069_28880 [Anaerolineae bacterium]|nr:hypothetical protein [Anaerolineae bacterium]
MQNDLSKPACALIIFLLFVVVLGVIACQPGNQVLNESEISSTPVLTSNISVATAPPTRVTNPDCDPSNTPNTDEPVKIAYIKGGNIWVWDETTQESLPLTDTGDVLAFKRSPDQQLIAYERGYYFDHDLWVMDADGHNAHLLVSSEELMSLQKEPAHEFIVLGQWEWQPEEHMVAYAPQGLLRSSSEFKRVLYEELYLIKTETGERFPAISIPNRSGDFQFSPDGSQIAAVTDFGISLFNSNGENFRSFEMEHDPWYVGMGDISPRIYWSQDSTSLRTIFSTEDSVISGGDTVLTIWEVPADDFTDDPIPRIATNGFFANAQLSPNLKYLVVQAHHSIEGDKIALRIFNIENGEMIYSNSDYEIISFDGWHPDSVHFNYYIFERDSTDPVNFIADLCAGSARRFAPTADLLLSWVNYDQYLYYSRLVYLEGDPPNLYRELWLGMLGGKDQLVEPEESDLNSPIRW